MYEKKDIVPEYIIFELITNEYGCSGIPAGSRTNLYLSDNIENIALICEHVLKDLFSCEAIDKYSYIDIEGVYDGDTSISMEEEQVDKIIEDYLGKISKEIQHIAETTDAHKYEELKQVLKKYYLCDEIGLVCKLQDYLKDDRSYEWLLEQFEEEDEEGEITKEVSALKLPGDEELIAKAINKINESQFQ